MDFQSWLASVVGKVLSVDGSGDAGQCTAVVHSYAEAVYPGVAVSSLTPLVPAAKDLFTSPNTHYFTPIVNDHSNPDQLPLQGDVMVFSPTPEPGYADTYNNPSGHTGICEAATPTSYTLVQQNAPHFGSPVNLTTYPWHFRPCVGWLRPVVNKPPEYYTVVSGDTVTGICERFGISIANGYAAFKALNPQVADINKIYPNEHVRVA